MSNLPEPSTFKCQQGYTDVISSIDLYYTDYLENHKEFPDYFHETLKFVFPISLSSRHYGHHLSYTFLSLILFSPILPLLLLHSYRYPADNRVVSYHSPYGAILLSLLSRLDY